MCRRTPASPYKEEAFFFYMRLDKVNIRRNPLNYCVFYINISLSTFKKTLRYVYLSYIWLTTYNKMTPLGGGE